MFICRDCQHEFSEPVVKHFTDMVEFWGAMVPMEYTEPYCPICGSEDFDET